MNQELRVGNIADLDLAGRGQKYSVSVTHEMLSSSKIALLSPVKLDELQVNRFGFEHDGAIYNPRTDGAMMKSFDVGTLYKYSQDLVEVCLILDTDGSWHYLISQTEDNEGAIYHTKEIPFVHQLQNLFYWLNDTHLDTDWLADISHLATQEPSPILIHFDRETKIMVDSCPETDKLIVEPFLPAIRQFIGSLDLRGESLHSGPYTMGAIVDTIKKSLLLEPIYPVTGDESEWIDISEEQGKSEPYYMNVRCGGLFKDHEGRATYSRAIIFQGEEAGNVFQGQVESVRSTQSVTFPFTPKSIYVDVYCEPYDAQKHGKDANYVEQGNGDFIYFIKDRSQLEEVDKYYSTIFSEKTSKS